MHLSQWKRANFAVQKGKQPADVLSPRAVEVHAAPSSSRGFWLSQALGNGGGGGGGGGGDGGGGGSVVEFDEFVALVAFAKPRMLLLAALAFSPPSTVTL